MVVVTARENISPPSCAQTQFLPASQPARTGDESQTKIFRICEGTRTIEAAEKAGRGTYVIHVCVQLPWKEGTH